MRQIRPLGDITLDMEELIADMVDEHNMQWGEILNIVRGYLEIHRPDAQEEYDDGGNPEFYYGPKVEPQVIKQIVHINPCIKDKDCI